MPRAPDALLAPLGAGAWCALDTETTGLGPYDQVVEVAVISASGRTLLDSTARPARPVSKKAAAVHGLGDAELASAPTWSTVWARLRPLLRDATLVAWNASFDLRLLRQTCDRHGLPFQAPRFVCLREAFRRRHPLVRSSLAAACLTLGLPQRPLHRAHADAELVRRLAWCLLDDG